MLVFGGVPMKMALIIEQITSNKEQQVVSSGPKHQPQSFV